jgi:hypothetical protein
MSSVVQLVRRICATARHNVGSDFALLVGAGSEPEHAATDFSHRLNAHIAQRFAGAIAFRVEQGGLPHAAIGHRCQQETHFINQAGGEKGFNQSGRLLNIFVKVALEMGPTSVSLARIPPIGKWGGTASTQS